MNQPSTPMNQPSTPMHPTPEQNKQPEIRAGVPLTDAEKKAQADKAQPQNGNTKA